MPFSYVQFMTELMAPTAYPRQPDFEPPRLTPLRKPIRESTIDIFTSAGIQLRSDTPLAETNDLSYRLIDCAVPYSELTVAHQTPVRVWALEDLNVAFPRERLAELEAEGTIGRLASKAVSMASQILPKRVSAVPPHLFVPENKRFSVYEDRRLTQPARPQSRAKWLRQRPTTRSLSSCRKTPMPKGQN